MALLQGANSLTPRGGTPARLLGGGGTFSWKFFFLARWQGGRGGEGRGGEGFLLVIAVAGVAFGAGAADDDVGA